MITTFWLVIMISVAGGPWRLAPDGDKKYPDRTSCEQAAHDRWEHIEGVHLTNEAGEDIDEEFEIGVSCQMHHSKSDPA